MYFVLEEQNKTVKWSLKDSLKLLRFYNLKKPHDLGFSKNRKQIHNKIGRIGLPKIKRKLKKDQEKINLKIYNDTIRIIKHFNKTNCIDFDYLKKIKPEHRSIVINIIPKIYFNKMKRQTEIINFIKKNKKIPSLKSKNKKERVLAYHLNNEQYSKKHTPFIKTLNKIKEENNIKNKIGEKKPRVENTFKKLLYFIEKNQKIPSVKSNSDKEKKLARFFSATCTFNGSNFKPDIVLPHISLFLKYMEHPSYLRTKKRYIHLLETNNQKELK